MAFLTGAVRITGNDGKFIYYESGGKFLVRKYTKKPKGAVNNDANYAKTRLASIEFAACSSLAADWYKAAKLYLPYLKNWYAMGKFTAALRSVVNGSAAALGERELSMSKYKDLALGMELNSKCNFVDVFKMPFVISVDAATKEVITEIAAFNPSQFRYNNSGATLLRLFSYVVVVEDCTLDAATKKYIPKSNLKPITGRFSFSEYIPLIQNKDFSIRLKTDLEDILVNRPHAQAFVWLGAELCRRNNNSTEVLYNQSVCKLVQVVSL